jgi:hypothetical protein
MTDIQSSAQHQHHHHHLAPCEQQQQQHAGMAGAEGGRQPIAPAAENARASQPQSQMGAGRTSAREQDAAVAAVSASMPINEQEIGQYKEQDRFLPVSGKNERRWTILTLSRRSRT